MSRCTFLPSSSHARRTLFACGLALAATLSLMSVGPSGRLTPVTDTTPAAENIEQPVFSSTDADSAEARRAAILQDTSGTFPESLQALLERHPDALGFVEDYHHKDDAPADTIGEVVQGQFPLLLQWDSRWGYTRYGDDLLAVTGCGPTCLAMAAAGLTGDDTITPAAVAQRAQRDGYWGDGVTSWGLMTTGCEAWGLVSEELPLTESAVTGALSEGRPIICSVRPGILPPPDTSSC